MSLAAMALVWEMDLPLHEKIVLLRIADGCDDGETFHVDISATAKACGLSDGALQACLESLQECRRLIINELRYDAEGRVYVQGVLTHMGTGGGNRERRIRRA